MKTLRDIKYLKDVRVLVRVDFNVPVNIPAGMSLKDAVVVDDYRIRAALPTIEFLRGKGAKVILMSHIESPDGEKSSLEPVAKKLVELGVPVIFCKDYRKAASAIEAINSGNKDVGGVAGSCILLENLRQFPGEKVNDAKFAAELSSLADIYVNDAFPVCHREHASVVGVSKLLPSYAGLQLEREIFNLSKAFKPAHPFVFVLGGAKFETKIPLLEKFLQSADNIFIGGALANDFFKAKGYEVGKSLVSEGVMNGSLDFSKYVQGEKIVNVKIMIPVDVVNEAHETKMANNVSANDKIVDVGQVSMDLLRVKISEAKFVLWNGPLGLYEDGYQDATLELAKMIAENTSAVSMVGGGDTVAAIANLGLQDKFTFISTGGGAMLDFLARGTLPGIEALK